MEYAQKMALVDYRVLENIQPQLPFRAAVPVVGMLQRLDDEMSDILERAN